MWFSVWLNDSSGFTVQDWGLQGSTWFPAWEQGIDYGDGHWVFSLRHIPMSGAWNLSIDSLAPNETYCFEGNLKVFDNTIGAFVWVDDATPMCFSTPQTNNTGGNNTGGNNTGGNNTGGNNTGGNNTGGNNTGGNNTGGNNTGGNNTGGNNTGGNNTGGNNTGGNNTGGNNTALDTDGDGVEDTIDNCPFVANLDQADTDDDGIGTACDEDESSTSEESDSVPSIGMLATSLCMLGAAILVRRD
jgi:hypothetical protein